jgi:hypothetical protein
MVAEIGSNYVVSAQALTVFGPTYRNWIRDNGGSTEAALGFLLECKKGNSNKLDDGPLITNPEKFKNIYNMYLQQVKDKSYLEDLGLVKKWVGNAITNYINQPANEQIIDKAALHGKLAVALDTNYYGGEQLSTFIIKVICRTLFDEESGESIKTFLLESDELLKQNPTMSGTHAVYLATIKMLAAWAREQMSISFVK